MVAQEAVKGSRLVEGSRLHRWETQRSYRALWDLVHSDQHRGHSGWGEWEGGSLEFPEDTEDVDDRLLLQEAVGSPTVDCLVGVRPCARFGPTS